ncbi:MAG: hypothetical protein J6V53_03495 [Alphaproteobacteria bacterium]|nr:hypothetical protein [Alphaproteobacteria bacterium]
MEQKEINQLSQTLRKLVKIGKKEFFSIPYKNEHATYALAVLLFDNKHQGANLFLNKDDFNKLYPLLNEIVEWTDRFTIIVTSDTLSNDKLREAMPFETDSHFNETHPTVKSLMGHSATVKVVEMKEDERYPSFILMNNIHLLRFIDANALGCCVNVKYNSQERQRHEEFKEVFQDLVKRSIPYSPDLVKKQNLNFDIKPIRFEHTKE